VRAARDKVAQKREVAAGLVKKANSDRQAYEQQLVEMAEAHKAIEQLLAALPSGSGLHGSYKGAWAGTFIWPMKGRITSPFGMRFHPILKCRKMHQGIDIAFAGCGGTPVVAAADGRVVHSGWRGALGVSVILDHGSGMGTIYGHFRTGSLHVSTGQNVRRGQVLGRCGTTGRSTGDHLHFGVVKNGRCVDPMDYL
jgi:murein DD-endopeptidase MepM/ murein hydrolase activator NlpD